MCYTHPHVMYICMCMTHVSVDLSSKELSKNRSKMAATSSTCTWANFTTTAPVAEVVRCTRHRARESKGESKKGDVVTSNPTARTACLTCAAYLCSKCDAEAHAAGTPNASHYRFPVCKYSFVSISCAVFVCLSVSQMFSKSHLISIYPV
jgi:hypothetical protein